MGNNNRDYELMHYGVKGMRWGHRKNYYGVGTGGILSRTKTKREEREEEYKKKRGINPNYGKESRDTLGEARKNSEKIIKGATKVAKGASKVASVTKSDRGKKVVAKLSKVLNKKISDLNDERNKRQKERLERALFPYKEEQEKRNRRGY